MAKTISGGLVDDKLITPVVIFAGLVGAIMWNLTTWYVGLPSSSSHALFGGLIGLGGGAVMIPLMVRFFKFSQHQGHGTSLMALVFTGLSGAVTYYLKGSVDIWAAVLLAASAMLTALKRKPRPAEVWAKRPNSAEITVAIFG